MKISAITTVLLLIFASLGANVVLVVATDSKDAECGYTGDNLYGFLLIKGYQVDRPDKIGRVGNFTRFLAENFDLGVEIVEKRTPTSRFFRNSDGTITAYFTVSPTCYQDEKGVWHDIADEKGADLELQWEGKSCCYGYVWYKHERGYWTTLEEKVGCRVSRSGTLYLPVGQHARKWWWKKFIDEPNSYQYYSRAFAQWNISSIPRFTTYGYGGVDSIERVRIRFYVSSEWKDLFHNGSYPGHRQYADLMIYNIEKCKPSSYENMDTEDQDSEEWNKIMRMMKDCRNGTLYAGPIRVSRKNPSLVTIDITKRASRRLEYNLYVGLEWFAVGFVDQNENKGAFENKCGGIVLKGGGSYLILEVTYTLIPGYCAIFVEGGINDDLQYCFHRTASYGYETFKELGYKDDYLFYLKWPRKSELKYLITETVPKYIKHRVGNQHYDLFIYFIDHGVGTINPWSDRKGNFILRPEDGGGWEEMTPENLDGWLYTMEEKSGAGFTIILIESCYSGVFIGKEPGEGVSGLRRVVMTSTDKDNPAWGNTNGYAFFSKPFFDALREGKTYGEAWEYADSKIDPPKKDDGVYVDVTRNIDIITEISRYIRIIEKTFIRKIFADIFKGILKLIVNGSCSPFLKSSDEFQREQNPKIDDNGDGKGAGTQYADKLPLGKDGELAKKLRP